MALDHEGNVIKQGDIVFFKEDIEGEGEVLEIIVNRYGPDTFVIDAPYHCMARWNTKHGQKVITTDRVWLEEKRQ